MTRRATRSTIGIAAIAAAIIAIGLLDAPVVQANHCGTGVSHAAGGACPTGAPAGGGILGGVHRVGGAAGYQQQAGETTFAGIVGKVINGATALLGVIFVAQMVYAGYLWMTATGEEEQLTKAKHIIRRSIVGLAIVLAAWAITTFVLSRITAATGVS